MGMQKWSDSQFGERVKRARGDRGWSQPEMANRLREAGIEPMHTTTLAKIEAGVRSVRINEAAGIADLLGISLDALLGRAAGPADNDLQFALRVLRDSARASSEQALDVAHDLDEQVRHITATFAFDDVDEIKRLAAKAKKRLDSAYDAVEELALLGDEILRRRRPAEFKPIEYAKVRRT